MLTIEKLKAMPDHAFFATGTIPDNADGLNMTGSGDELRWVAVRGTGYHDWAIYVRNVAFNIYWIAESGDKVHSAENIKKLVPCDDESYAMYRH